MRKRFRVALSSVVPEPLLRPSEHSVLVLCVCVCFDARSASPNGSTLWPRFPTSLSHIPMLVICTARDLRSTWGEERTRRRDRRAPTKKFPCPSPPLCDRQGRKGDDVWNRMEAH